MSVLTNLGRHASKADPSPDAAHSAGGGPASATGFFRSVVARVTTPLLPDDYLHMVNPLWSARELRGKIIAVVPETGDAATLVIKPGWGWNLSYQAGQYVGIGVHLNGKWHWRSYSISSSRRRWPIETPPRPPDHHGQGDARGVPVRAPGPRPGSPETIVRLALPQGEFVLPDPPPAKILFWTGGSRHHASDGHAAHARQPGAPCPTWSTSTPLRRWKPPSSAKERVALAARHGGLQLIENFDDRHGVLDVDRLTEVCPDWKAREAWVCGPAPMLAAAESRWEKRQAYKKAAPRAVLRRRSPRRPREGDVTFATSGKTAEVDGATTLLEAGEAAGIQMPFGCRMGICHTCIVPLKRGMVKDLRNGAEYQENAGVQTCITAAAGDCVLEI